MDPITRGSVAQIGPAVDNNNTSSSKRGKPGKQIWTSDELIESSAKICFLFTKEFLKIVVRWQKKMYISKAFKLSKHPRHKSWKKSIMNQIETVATKKCIYLR